MDTNIFQRINKKVQTLILPSIPNKLQRRFIDGINMFSLNRLDSLNANGRKLNKSRTAGEMTAYRVSREERFLDLIPAIIGKLIKSSSIKLCLDFSTFNNVQIACIALQTGKGRAIPVWLKTFNLKPGGLIKNLIKTIEIFLTYLDPQTQITITMDRWFAIEESLKYPDGKGIKFICRLRSNIPVKTSWEDKIKVLEISDPDIKCVYKEMKLRLVQSRWSENMKQKEPWFLLTNDFDRTRQQIVNCYKKRFEIEEFFKDVKWIQDYEWHQIKTPLVLDIVLLFVFLGWWLLLECGKEIIRVSRSRKINKKKVISLFRALFEELEKSKTEYITLLNNF